MEHLSEKLEQAMAKRAWPSKTDAMRIFHGEFDGEPELWIDNFAGHWLWQTLDAVAPAATEECLERFGGRSLWWKRLDKEEKAAPLFMAGHPPTSPFPVRENGLSYLADFGSGYSQGIFLDQRLNRARVREQCRPGKTVLNLFGYTGAFSVAAAAGGAVTTTLDLSQPALNRAKENFVLNQLDPGAHFWIKGDAFEWLAHFAKKQRRFDGVILDPPTFSRSGGSGKRRLFRVEKDYAELVRLAAQVMAPGGWMLASTNCRQLEWREFRYMVEDGCINADLPMPRLERLPMPPEYGEDEFLKSAWVS